MGSLSLPLNLSTHPHPSQFTMPDAASLLMPLKELLADEDFVSKVEDTARALPRLFYQNSVLTIDTHVYFLWATVVLAVLLALAYLIFGDWSKLEVLAMVRLTRARICSTSFSIRWRTCKPDW